MKIFISGGAKNGKSFYAQTRAKEMSDEHNAPLYYIATMIPHDEEDRARIRRHLTERDGWGFITLEQPTGINGLVKNTAVDIKGAFLLDSVTALLANEMFSDAGFDGTAPDRVIENLKEFASAAENIVFVSDYLYGYRQRAEDAGEQRDYTDEYVRGLAQIDRFLAGICDQVIEISAGLPIIHKDRK